MIFCIPKFPLIPASLQKLLARQGLELHITAARQAPVAETRAHLSGKAEKIPSIYAPLEFAGNRPTSSECFGIGQDRSFFG
jgi:hypothetical protein